MDNMSMDVLHGTFTTYELRVEKENSRIKEATFKATNEERKHRNKEYSNHEFYEEESSSLET